MKQVSLITEGLYLVEQSFAPIQKAKREKATKDLDSWNTIMITITALEAARARANWTLKNCAMKFL